MNTENSAELVWRSFWSEPQNPDKEAELLAACRRDPTVVQWGVRDWQWESQLRWLGEVHRACGAAPFPKSANWVSREADERFVRALQERFSREVGDRNASAGESDYQSPGLLAEPLTSVLPSISGGISPRAGETAASTPREIAVPIISIARKASRRARRPSVRSWRYLAWAAGFLGFLVGGWAVWSNLPGSATSPVSTAWPATAWARVRPLTAFKSKAPLPSWIEKPTTVELISGTLEWEFPNGSVAMVNGPGEFHLEGPNEWSVSAGQFLWAPPANESVNMEVRTPQAVFLPRPESQMWLDVKPDQSASVWVAQGEVDWVPVNSESAPQVTESRPRMLTAQGLNQALFCQLPLGNNFQPQVQLLSGNGQFSGRLQHGERELASDSFPQFERLVQRLSQSGPQAAAADYQALVELFKPGALQGTIEIDGQAQRFDSFSEWLEKTAAMGRPPRVDVSESENTRDNPESGSTNFRLQVQFQGQTELIDNLAEWEQFQKNMWKEFSQPFQQGVPWQEFGPGASGSQASFSGEFSFGNQTFQLTTPADFQRWGSRGNH